MKHAYQNFTSESVAPWRRHLTGEAALEHTGSSLRLVTADTTRRSYTNAQLDDSHRLPRQRYAWSPPLRMTLRARFSHSADQLGGTAGFGFWNYPSFASGNSPFVPPRAIWFFFGSPPGDLKLDMHTSGYGWKAATIDTGRPAALALVPLAPLLVPLMNSAPLYRRIWPPVQRAVGVREAPIHADMTDWHIYTLDWGTRYAHFLVDGRPVLEYAPSPRGPLCFVAWLDNQYAVIKPWGRFGWGLLDIMGKQWLEVDWLAIERDT